MKIYFLLFNFNMLKIGQPRKFVFAKLLKTGIGKSFRNLSSIWESLYLWNLKFHGLTEPRNFMNNRIFVDYSYAIYWWNAIERNKIPL